MPWDARGRFYTHERARRRSVINFYDISDRSAERIVNGRWPQRAGYRAMLLQSRYRRTGSQRDRDWLLRLYVSYIDRQRDAALRRAAIYSRIERNRRDAQWRLFVHRNGGVDERGYFSGPQN